MLARFALLVAASIADAYLTAAEAAAVGVPPEGIEANPAMRYVLHTAGLGGMLVCKLVPLAVLGAAMLYRPMPRVVGGLLAVFGALMAYHAVLWAA